MENYNQFDHKTFVLDSLDYNIRGYAILVDNSLKIDTNKFNNLIKNNLKNNKIKFILKSEIERISDNY